MLKIDLDEVSTKIEQRRCLLEPIRILCLTCLLISSNSSSGQTTYEEGDSFVLKNQSLSLNLRVPKEYIENYSISRSDYIIVNAMYPNMSAYESKIHKADNSKIRIEIALRGKETRTSTFLKDHERLSKGNKQTTSKYLGRDGVFDLYSLSTSRSSKNTETWRVAILPDGTQLGLLDQGEYSSIIKANRLIKDQIEVNYQFRKSLNIDPIIIDKSVVGLVEKFMMR